MQSIKDLLEGDARFYPLLSKYYARLRYDDLECLTARDLIKIVPEDDHEMRLLATIMVKRHLLKYLSKPSD